MNRLTRRRFLRNTAALGLALPLIDRAARAEPAGEGRWLAGELHVHTTYSGDVWSGPGDDNTGTDEAYTLGWSTAEQIAIAESRGLDFLAITDHGDVRALSDAGYRSEKLTLIRGYEHSLRRGHAGCLGVASTFSIDTSAESGALALRDAVRAAGGLFILNHPFYGSGWGYNRTVRPDSIEVWNIAWPYRRELFPVVSTSENYRSLPYWEQFLDEGRMPATGGSDNHWRSTTAAQGAGQPCTWVFATGTTEAAILDGIRAGRTFVTAEPPGLGGARLELTAEKGMKRWMVGDTVPASEGIVTVVARLQGAPGNLLRFAVDGVYSEPVPIALPDQSVAVALDASQVSRVRAEAYLEEGFWMTALTSPIYFG